MSVTRRDFIKCSAFLGGSILLCNRIERALAYTQGLESRLEAGKYVYELAAPENIIYSVCLQCHQSCPIKGKILDGVLVKIDGNPYGTQTMLRHIDLEVPPHEAATIDGRVCIKGQAGVQTLYDPYRIRKVLKRKGPRGSGRWETISFEQAVAEICNGGDLFGEGPVEGLKDTYALRDPKTFKAMAAEVEKIQAGKMTVAAFQERFKDHLDVLIDPDHPDLGPKNNGFVFCAGRIEHGRKELMKRWTAGSFGSVNYYEHTTICEQSHHIAYEQATSTHEGGFTWEGGKHHLKPDLLNSEFVIFFGTGAFEANFGVTSMAEKVTHSLRERNFRYAVVDPRCSKTAAKAQWWVPIIPGTDGALAYGLIRSMLEGERFDRTYLENANKAAATADREPTWTNAAHLVTIGADGIPGNLLRASDIGLGSDSEFVVMKDGRPQTVDMYSTDLAVEGELFIDGKVQDIPVKSALQLVREEAFSRSLAEWSEICGVEVATIQELAHELTSYGKKAAVEFYRGPVQHTNGYYAALALIYLNMLIGNIDWKGGLGVGGGHWHETGSKKNQPYNLKSGLHPAKLEAFGPPVTKEKSRYEDSTLFDGYPAKRPWYPFSSNVYQEIIPAGVAGYPYRIKVLYLHKGTPALSTPAGHLLIDMIKDPKKVPLFIASDIVIGETSMYADYIFPDPTYMERWGTPHITPDVLSMSSKIRQPMVPPVPEVVNLDGRDMPISMEAFLIAVGKKLGLSGIGKDAFGSNMDFHSMEDYFLKLAANLAAGDHPPDDSLPDADEKEMNLFLEARRHLPRAVFDPDHWQKAAGEQWWRKVVYLLNRGGRFAPGSEDYKGDYLGSRWGKNLNFYIERVARQKDSTTGKNFWGYAKHIPVMHSTGEIYEAPSEYDFHLITHKEVTGGQSRTIGNYWSDHSILPSNKVCMNRKDAERLGIEDGQLVHLSSASNGEGLIDLGNGKRLPVQGEVQVMEGIRPGVVSISWHYGHWAYGSSEVEVDGAVIPGDTRRRGGLCPNSLMAIDKALQDVCLTDPIGASSSFYDTRVRVVKV